MGLTIVCWLWRGWNPIYGPDDVHRLQAQCAEFMPSHRFVCITDDPAGIECETFPLWSFPEIDQSGRLELIVTDIEAKREREGRGHIPYNRTPLLPDCFRRLRLFDPEIGHQLGEYILSIDLDCKIFGEFDPGRHRFKILRGYARSKYCGSMWMLKAGELDYVWHDFDPVETPKFLAQQKHNDRPLIGSDQAWMSTVIPNAPTWSQDDGIYQARQLMHNHRSKAPDDMRICFAAGRLKLNSDECRLFIPWLYQR